MLKNISADNFKSSKYSQHSRMPPKRNGVPQGSAFYPWSFLALDKISLKKPNRHLFKNQPHFLYVWSRVKKQKEKKNPTLIYICLTLWLILNDFFIVRACDSADNSAHTTVYHSGCIHTTESKPGGPLCAQNKQMHLRCSSRFRIPSLQAETLIHNSFIHWSRKGSSHKPIQMHFQGYSYTWSMAPGVYYCSGR